MNPFQPFIDLFTPKRPPKKRGRFTKARYSRKAKKGERLAVWRESVMDDIYEGEKTPFFSLETVYGRKK